MQAQQLNKSELGRRLEVEPANIRRLFSNRGNPTIRTISDLAFELGFEMQLVPIVKPKRTAK